MTYVNTVVMENTPKATYILRWSRSSLWVTSGDSIMAGVRILFSQRF